MLASTLESTPDISTVPREATQIASIAAITNTIISRGRLLEGWNSKRCS